MNNRNCPICHYELDQWEDDKGTTESCDCCNIYMYEYDNTFGHIERFGDVEIQHPFDIEDQEINKFKENLRQNAILFYKLWNDNRILRFRQF